MLFESANIEFTNVVFSFSNLTPNNRTRVRSHPSLTYRPSLTLFPLWLLDLLKR
ncbi:hypothetical protein Hanom_Chr02g00115901 [Helianthus anomalus]